MIDYRVERYKGFEVFHVTGMKLDEIDPAAPMLKYISEHLKLDEDQRYWLSYLYSTCYSAPTAYYMILNLPRVQYLTREKILGWWTDNKSKLVFETDRLRAKTQNQIPRMFLNYKSLVGYSDSKFFKKLLRGTPKKNYRQIYMFLEKNLYYFGRYSLFMYLETIYNLTELPIWADTLELKEALSSRNGLCFLLGLDNWVRHQSVKRDNLNDRQYEYLQMKLRELYQTLLNKYPETPTTYWNLETSLCAYKKLFFGTRYVGYYIDRQLEELSKMQKLAPEIDWTSLWDFRKNHFDRRVLGELNNWRGIRKERMKYFLNTGRFIDYEV